MASKKWIVDLNLTQQELQNAVIQNLATAPANPKAGQIWYDTSTNLIYFHDGTTNKAVGYLPAATTTTLGGVIVGSHLNVANDGTLSVVEASTSTKGVIEIATDSEASTGTSEVLAINPKQLATKLTANAAITAATKCKITYDAKGLVTAGADLQASDIPNLSLSKITDVTASASEVNVLDGITASTAELNVLDGITASTTELNYVDGVTSSIQTQLDNKVAKVSSASKVYGTDSSSAQTTYNISSSATENTVAYRSTGGVLNVGTPTADTHAATKKYVDDGLSEKQDTLVSGTNIKTINSNSILGSGDITIDSLPSQSGQNGKFLTTNGSTASWANVPSNLPSMTGNSGKYLTNDGTTASWGEITAFTAAEVDTIWNSVTPAA